MNIDRDPEAVMAAWLDDGPAAAHGHVRPSRLASGLHPRQKPGIGWPSFRVPTMNLRRLSLGLGQCYCPWSWSPSALALSFYSNQQLGPGPSPRGNASRSGFPERDELRGAVRGPRDLCSGRGSDRLLHELRPLGRRPQRAVPRSTLVRLEETAHADGHCASDSVPLGWSSDGTKLLLSAQRSDRRIVLVRALPLHPPCGWDRNPGDTGAGPGRRPSRPTDRASSSPPKRTTACTSSMPTAANRFGWRRRGRTSFSPDGTQIAFLALPRSESLREARARVGGERRRHRRA